MIELSPGKHRGFLQFGRNSQQHQPAEDSVSDGSNLLSRTDDNSLSLPTVELQPVCSHPVFDVGKEMEMESRSSWKS